MVRAHIKQPETDQAKDSIELRMSAVLSLHARCLFWMQDVGRSVAAFGYWGDILNSPYHCFGTVAEDDALFKFSNKQYNRTAVDVAEHNILVRITAAHTFSYLIGCPVSCRESVGVCALCCMPSNPGTSIECTVW